MKIALGIAFLAALLSIGRFTLISTRQLTHPVDVLNESPTVNTALLLNKGVNIYAQSTRVLTTPHRSTSICIRLSILLLCHPFPDFPILPLQRDAPFHCFS